MRSHWQPIDGVETSLGGRHEHVERADGCASVHRGRALEYQRVRYGQQSRKMKASQCYRGCHRRLCTQMQINAFVAIFSPI
jgi:hypothetical protein